MKNQTTEIVSIAENILANTDKENQTLINVCNEIITGKDIENIKPKFAGDMPTDDDFTQLQTLQSHGIKPTVVCEDMKFWIEISPELIPTEK